jgi:phospholipid-binding lipoprotein MlaA
LDRLLIRPLAELYRNMVPPPVRDRITGITTNMKEPVIFANNLLQGEFGKAETTFERFGTNTVLGGAGMFDVATGWGMQQQTGDFGQTLAVWGVKEGPYLVLPFFGPSNFRDAVGLGVDMVMSPWGYLAYDGGNGTGNRFEIASFSADGLTQREQNIEALDALRSGSLDFYAQMRSVYRQYRAKQIGNQSTSDMPKFEDYYK